MTATFTFEGQPSDPERGPTQFQSVGDAPATYNGYTLMVTAYALIWVILMVWLLMMWQKSRAIAARVADLDLAIDRAAQKASSAEAELGAKKSVEKKPKKDADADGTADS